MKPFTITLTTAKQFNAFDFLLGVARVLDCSDGMDRDGEEAHRLLDKLAQQAREHRRVNRVPLTPQYEVIWKGTGDNPGLEDIVLKLRAHKVGYVINATCQGTTLSVLETVAKRVAKKLNLNTRHL